MNFRMNARVRHSLAEELKKLASRGSAVIALLGWGTGSGYLILGMAAWWLLQQALAHLLLSIEEI